ncbi:cellulase [Shimwellia pseudoproteus]|uniref:cellulose synthase complex periplasmic endoglucanase BcsZ n=1 Tax=Shimwellia pseudoproteus TaxID=570012 RepID=UPI0018EC2D44|nr:cellulose synthase complex periplasmic endoglucanase BcsZ [Shimwellia pseudoproteus]MBJ3814273.1 cellulase [Shimwellia pseudoproteus]
MRKGWYGCALAVLVASGATHAATQATRCSWPAWEQFKTDYLSDQGRVIDPSDARQITTSEGQSYALFFALVADDQATFDKVLGWTQNNLAQGALADHLPAWLWGKNKDNQWLVLDTNSAADADMWIAWALLEGGRLWGNDHYTQLGEQLLSRIGKEEVASVPGLGTVLLPGKTGFVHKDSWRLNPSYLPPQVLARMVRYHAPWSEMQTANNALLVATSPKGYVPDWVTWHKGSGWQMDPQPPLVGSYDAIRVYLWAGMLSDKDPDKATLLNHFTPMLEATARRGAPPEKTGVADGTLTNDGPVGFSAALLPAMQDNPALSIQRQRLADNFPARDAYYNYVLALFGQGWDQQRYRFTVNGELVRHRDTTCASSH